MKRLAYCLFALSVLSAQSYAGIFGSLFGISAKYEKRVTDLKDSVNKQFADNQLKVTGLESRIGEMEVNMSMQANAVAKVQLGLDKSNTQNAGRDIIKSTTNDSKLMTQIFQGLSALFLAVLAFLKARVNALAKHNEYLTESRHRYQDRFMRLLSPDYNKLVEKEKEA